MNLFHSSEFYKTIPKMLVLLLLISYSKNYKVFAKQEVNKDSLKAVWQNEVEPDTSRLKAIHRLIWDGYLFSNPDSALYLTSLMFDYAKSISATKQMADALNMQGIYYALTNNYSKSLSAFNKSSTLFKESGNLKGCAAALVNIGVILTDQGNEAKAIDYYVKSIAISKELKDDIAIAKANNNIATIYGEQGEYEKALNYFTVSKVAFQKAEDKKGVASTLTNIAVMQKHLKNFGEAYTAIYRSIDLNKEIDNQRGLAKSYYHLAGIDIVQELYGSANANLSRALEIQKNENDIRGEVLTTNKMGSLFLLRKDYSQALSWCKSGFEVAKLQSNFSEQKTACECLYEANKAIGNRAKALEYLETKIAIEDTLNSTSTLKRLSEMEFANQLIQDSLIEREQDLMVEMQHQEELRKRSRTRNILIASALLILLTAGFLFSRLKLVRKTSTEIAKEKDKSDQLLLNILPEEIADELKVNGEAKAQHFNDVSILFTDFKGFTQLSEVLTPQELVAELDHCFKAFDEICLRYKIEKIKTIGDAYMAAGGLPTPSSNSTLNTVLAAIEMRDFLATRKSELAKLNKPLFDMRIGVHTGEVVAGIVGHTKFQYDLWGDTVNTASRMESSGEIGKVNISQYTYSLLKNLDRFSFKSRGKIQAKGKGEIEMYFVEQSA